MSKAGPSSGMWEFRAPGRCPLYSLADRSPPLAQGAGYVGSRSIRPPSLCQRALTFTCRDRFWRPLCPFRSLAPLLSLSTRGQILSWRKWAKGQRSQWHCVHLHHREFSPSLLLSINSTSGHSETFASPAGMGPGPPSALTGPD